MRYCNWPSITPGVISFGRFGSVLISSKLSVHPARRPTIIMRMYIFLNMLFSVNGLKLKRNISAYRPGGGKLHQLYTWCQGAAVQVTAFRIESRKVCKVE